MTRRKVVVAVGLAAVFLAGLIYARVTAPSVSEARDETVGVAQPMTHDSPAIIQPGMEPQGDPSERLMGDVSPPANAYSAPEDLASSVVTNDGLRAFLEPLPGWAESRQVFRRPADAEAPDAGSGAMIVLSSVKYVGGPMDDGQNYLTVTYAEPEGGYWSSLVLGRPFETRSDGTQVFLRPTKNSRGRTENVVVLVKEGDYIVSLASNLSLSEVMTFGGNMRISAK